jgi:hypothetical protein
MGRDGVMDAGATHGTGGVVGTVWGAAKVVGTTWARAEVSKAGDDDVVLGQAVRLPASVPWMV